MNYLFDVKMFASIRVEADTPEAAEQLITDTIECATGNLGAWPDGSPILCEISTDGRPDLIEEGDL